MYSIIKHEEQQTIIPHEIHYEGINLTVDIDNISLLSNDMDVKYISIQEYSIIENLIQQTPSQSDIIRDNLTTLVNKTEEEDKEENWLEKRTSVKKIFSRS